MRSSLLAFLLALSALAVSASDYTWTGKSSPNNHDWGDPQNWAPTNGPPMSGDKVTIANAEVTLGSDLAPGAVTIVNSELLGTGALELTVSSTLTYVDIGLAGGVTVSAPLDIYSYGGADIETLTEGPFVNNSTVTVHGDAEFQIGDGVEVVNYGTWVFTSESSLSMPQDTGEVAFLNEGSIYCTNASLYGADTILSNAAGATIFIAETNDFEAILEDAGTIYVSSNGLLSIDSSSRVELSSGPTFTYPAFAGAGTTFINCPVSVNGYADIAGNVQFLTDGANSVLAITIDGTLTIGGGGTLNWYAGALSGVGTNLTGTVLVNMDGALIIHNDANGMGLNNVLLTNNGTVIWTNSGGLYMSSSALIANAGFFYISGDGLLAPNVDDSSPVAFLNIGEVEKDIGASNALTSIHVPFNDAGELHVLQGNLQFTDGGSINYWAVEESASLKLSGGTFAAATDAEIISGGPVTMASPAMIDIPGDVTLKIVANFNQAGGTIFGSGTMTVAGGEAAGNYTWNGGTISITNQAAAVTIMTGGVMNIEGANNGKNLLYGALINQGTINWVNDNSVGGINLGDDAVIENAGLFSIQCDCYMNDISTSTNSAPTFYNEEGGTFSKIANTGTTTISVRFVDAGTIVAQSGLTEFVNFSDNYPDLPLPQIILAGGKIQFDNALVLHADISGSGQIIAKKGLTLSDGELTVVVIIFTGDITNDEIFDLGSFFGIITIQNGGFSQTAHGTIIVPIQGSNSAGGYGKLTASGNASLGGTIKVVLTNGYAPPVGLSFPFLSSSQISGTFTNLMLPQGLTVTYTGSGANIVVTNSVPVIIGAPEVGSGQFQFGFNTVSNRSYTVEFKTNLIDPTWIVLTNFTATSSNVSITLPVSSSTTGFIRVVEP